VLTELVGKTIGDFEIVRELGRGGMGVVYEARQVSLNRRVALKVLSAGLTSRAVVRFRREAETAAKLHHTNIVPVYATGDDSGLHFYAMELIDGPSLDHVIRDLVNRESPGSPATPVAHAMTGPYVSATPLTPNDSATSSSLNSGSTYFDAVARMIADVADALDHAHKNGVLHRDIKPANLLLAPDGRLSVNDFGLARLLEEPGMTVTGEFVGTPAYMSPEQVTAGRIPVDHRTDIYSLGATLYELLTLRPPFTAEGRDRLLAMVIQKEPASPRSVNPKTPHDLETICLKCLEKDPDRRFQSAKELADDLRRYVNRFAILAKRAGPLTKAKKWVKRNPAVAGLLFVVFLALGAAGAFAFRNKQLDEQRSAEGAKRQQEAKAERLRELIRNAMADALAGNFAAVDKAIDTAVTLDADAADIRILRGYVAYVAGRGAEALGHFQEAVRLRPNSVMAHALLGMAFADAMEWDKADEIRRRVETLPIEQPEDLLFKGVLAGYWDPKRGLDLMDEAMAMRPMNIGYLLRGDARSWWALETSNRAEVERALEEVATARLLFRDSPSPIASSLSAEVNASIIYGYFKDTAQRKQALEQAHKYANQLRSFPNYSEGLITLCTTAELAAFEENRPVAIPPEVTRFLEQKDHLYLTFFQSLIQFRAGRDAESLQALKSLKGGSHVDLLRVFVMMEMPDQKDKLAAILEEWSRDLSSYTTARSLFMIRLAQGQAELAATEMRRKFNLGLKAPPFPNGQDVAYRAFYASNEPDRESKFLQAVTGQRSNEADAHWLTGLRQLGSGERKAALASFQKAAETRSISTYSWELSLAFLERMNADPAWPPWAKESKKPDDAKESKP
jgi:tetratricopeptide (TPR) repeat protein